MKIKFRAILFFCMVFGSVNAQTTSNLSLIECQRMAKQYSKELKMKQVDNLKQTRQRKSLTANFLPKISASGLYMYNQKNIDFSLSGGKLPTFMPSESGIPKPDGGFAYMPDINLNFDIKNVYTVGVSAEQAIYMGGKVRSSVKMARIGEDMTRELVNVEQQNVVIEVEKAYWQLAQVKEKLTLAKSFVAITESLLEQVKNAQYVGKMIENNVLQVQVKCNDAKLMVEKANNGVTLAKMNLCRIVGLPLTTAIDITDSLDVTPNGITVPDSLLIENRSEYKLLQQQIELSSQNVKLQQSNLLPQIGTSVGYAYVGGMKLNGQELQQGSLNVMASLKIPVFHWNEERNKVKMAKMDKEIHELKKDQLAQLLQLEMYSNYMNMTSALTRVNMSEDALQQARENMRIVRDRYTVGKEILSNVLDAQSQWEKAWSDHIDAQVDYCLSRSAYLRSIGISSVDLYH